MTNSLTDTSRADAAVFRSFTTEAWRHRGRRGQPPDAKVQRLKETLRRTALATLRLPVIASNSPHFSVPQCLRGEDLPLVVSPHLELGERGGQP